MPIWLRNRKLTVSTSPPIFKRVIIPSSKESKEWSAQRATSSVCMTKPVVRTCSRGVPRQLSPRRIASILGLLKYVGFSTPLIKSKSGLRTASLRSLAVGRWEFARWWIYSANNAHEPMQRGEACVGSEVALAISAV
jgi:hypothetical protein